MTESWQEAHDLWRNRSPMRRAAKPEDIADLAAMIIRSDYLTGEVIVADGGLNLIGQVKRLTLRCTGLPSASGELKR
jgi:NAD(P)-dependent dehydrogenase (short-subunit alcohol dehydrogenase family)